MVLGKQKLNHHHGWPTLESTTTRSVRVSASYLTYTTLSDIDRARHKSMLDYLYNAGFMKTYNEFREEAPELVRLVMAIWSIKACWHLAEESLTLYQILRLQQAGCWSRSGRALFGCNERRAAIFNIPLSTKLNIVVSLLGDGSGGATGASPRRTSKRRTYRVRQLKTRQ